MKSDKNIVRDILKAQGLDWNTEPTAEAIKVLRDLINEVATDNYREGWRDGDEYNRDY